MTTPPLKLYRASAGSGKTFTLVVEYIILLIADPTAYRHILAVTFTNKATAEMKSRILTTLEGLRDSDPDTAAYFDKIRQSEEVKALNISDTELRRRAGIALHNLSHDYSRFHIETIDSFFISVIKDLARELNLPANLNIDLDTDDVLSEAVDNLIDNAGEDRNTFESLKQFIREKINDGKNWKLDDEIKKFGKNIFNEKYLDSYPMLKDKMSNSSFMQKYKTGLLSLRRACMEQLQSQGKQLLQICDNHGFSIDNFKYKEKGVYGYFMKLADLTPSSVSLPTVNSYTTKCLDSAEEWNKNDVEVQALAETTLLPLLRKTVRMQEEATETVNTVNAIIRHLNYLQLLTTISKEIDHLNLDADRFLLANSAYFLQQMIDRSSVPFIYEKSGARFTHIMIDEFQDTSDLQWSNFLPLLSNCLDSNEGCLIVGDVKQSIYRFRNSNWNILNTLDENPLLLGKVNTPPPLNTNRRSLGNVIAFNNDFFREAVNQLNLDYKATHANLDCIQLLKAYGDVEQGMKPEVEGTGYVHIDFLEKDAVDAELSYEERTLHLLIAHINSLLSQGIEQKDITILLRFNRYIPMISQFFSEYAPKLQLISDEAYQLTASPSVNIIIATLRYLTDPDDKLTLLRLLAYTTDVPYSTLLLSSLDELKTMLPTKIREESDSLPCMPVKDLIETIHNTFHLEQIKDQDAYLFYFHDQLAAFLDDKHNDIVSLLTYWDETLSTKTIPGNSSADGIRIMSIHKSKGLEFNTVIIPFCDWQTTGKPTDLMWCRPVSSPYDQMPIIPVNYIKDVSESIFRSEYDKETLRNNVDNLNLLYVAFTRAKNNLFIMTREKDESKNRKNDADTISDISMLINRTLKPEKDEYTRGTLVVSSKQEEKKDDSLVQVRFSTGSSLPEFRQSNRSKDFMAQLSDEEEEQPATRTDFIDKGLLYHNILENINTLADVDRIIDKMYMEGVFSSEEERQEARQHISEALSDPVCARWFQPDWTVVSERTIFIPQGTEWIERRPDRVVMSPTETIVIDYKTGVERKSHLGQVNHYVDYLRQMGYPDVKGYVWYIMDKKVVKV